MVSVFTYSISWKPLRFASWFPTLISCSPNLPSVYIRLCKHGNHFTFLQREKWQRSQLWLMWSPWRVAKYFGDLCLLHQWFIRKSVFLQIRYNTSKGPIFAGDCYLLHHLIADMDTRLERGDEVAYHRRNLCSWKFDGWWSSFGNFILLISYLSDSVNIKILNAGAWSRASERIPVSLPTDVSFKIVWRC